MTHAKGTNYENMPGEIGIRKPVPSDEDIMEFVDERCEPGWMSDRGKVTKLTTELQKPHRRRSL